MKRETYEIKKTIQDIKEDKKTDMENLRIKDSNRSWN
jgi:hypothetical protein